jgi:predicted nuclease of predicted toxin-antitoxin system
LAKQLADLFPGSGHVFSFGFDRAADEAIWTLAIRENFVIVSKDADFEELSVLRGFPPKVVWLRTGNSATQAVERLFRLHAGELAAFEHDTDHGVFLLG